ncbi:MAG: endospore germination permease [Tissierellia bacterium]|nr:endospore germination permease [Tissierellia bacterium]
MDGNNRISNEQIKALLITTVIGVGILSLPSDVAAIMRTGGWVAIVIGGILIIPFIIIIDRIFKLYPGKSIFQIGQEVMPPWIFKLILLILLAYMLFILSYGIRVFAEVIKAYLLETTPTEVIIITMLIAVSYIARSNIEAIARMAVMIYPIILGFTIFIILVNLPNTDYTNIYPVFDIDYARLPKGIMGTIFAYAGYELIIFVLPLSEDSNGSLMYNLRGLFIVMGVYLIMFFITLSRYGVFQLQREIWPSIAVVKEVDLPGFFLENLDGIVMAAWVMVVYGSMGPSLYAAGLILSNILNTRYHNIFIPFFLPIIYIVALLPSNLVQVYEKMGAILNYITAVAIFLIPIIIFASAYIKKRRGRT